MTVSAPVNGVKVYNVTAGKTMPEWMAERQKGKSLRYNDDFRSRVELIQDFDFPSCGQRLRVTPDGQYCLATGTYKPQLRCYEFSQLSMKFERHVDSEIAAFDVLTDDFSKLVLLHTDRTVSFHARFGFYHKTRIPKFGRDLAYQRDACELVLAASGADVYRLNLELGQYMAPLASGHQSGNNVVEVSPRYPMLAVGGDDGFLQFWDTRQRRALASLDVGKAMYETAFVSADNDAGVTALTFHPGGMMFAAGTRGGQSLLFDVRSERPLLRHTVRMGCARSQDVASRSRVARGTSSAPSRWPRGPWNSSG